jgi:rhamnosyltransferase
MEQEVVNSKTVDIVIPLFKSSSTLDALLRSLCSQKKIQIGKIVFPITESPEIEKEISILSQYQNAVFFKVEPKEFSHSLTRQKAILDYCTSPYVVLMSQDVTIGDDFSIFHLVNILSPEVVYSYGRQMARKKNIEQYTREKNYPNQSNIVSKDNIDELGLITFFASDAFSAIDRAVFVKCGGYDNEDMKMNEDMFYAYKVLNLGYKKAYCADAVVFHSHNYRLRSLYHRYYETGIWFRDHPQFSKFKATASGWSMFCYVLKRALKDFNIPVLFCLIPNMAARYLGMKKGKKQKER